MERSVEYMRRKAFSLSCNYASLEEAQSHLDDVCRRMDTESPLDEGSGKQLRISADLGSMREWPGDIGCFEAMEYNVDKWSTVCVKGNHYSVPDHLVGQRVCVKLYSDRLTVVKDRQKLASHERLSNQGKWSLKLEHYLRTLLRKPGALAGSVALQQVPHLVKELFDHHFSDSPRDFLELLQFARENGYWFRDITDAAARLHKRGLRSICADQLKAELYSKVEVTPSPGADPISTVRDLIPGQSSQIEELANVSTQGTDTLLYASSDNPLKPAI